MKYNVYEYSADEDLGEWWLTLIAKVIAESAEEACYSVLSEIKRGAILKLRAYAVGTRYKKRGWLSDRTRDRLARKRLDEMATNDPSDLTDF